MNNKINSRMTISFVLLILFMVTLFSGKSITAYSADNFFLVNSGFNGFDMESPVMVYNKTNIFAHINGEAEVYFPLGFRFLYLQSHRKQETGVVISVEAYDMSSSKGAGEIFKRYTQDGGSMLKDFTEKAWADEYRVLIYSDNYFIQVMPDPEAELDEEPSIEEMIELARLVDKALGN